MELLPRQVWFIGPLTTELMIVKGSGQLTTAEFPCDLDTTSLGLTVVRARVNVAASIMDEMLNYINEDGIVQVLILELKPPLRGSLSLVRHILTMIGRESIPLSA